VLNRRCNTLSQGQQQRVAIVRSLLQRFDWLLLDEPFSHLDKENQQRVFRLVEKRVAEEQAGWIVSSLGDKHGYSFQREITL
jgi:putative ABC transport system ATP-binding protein